MAGPQATLYFGGDILTMAGPTPEYVEALVVRGGRIEFAGAKVDAERRAGTAARTVDLGGRALLPGEAMTAEARDTFGLLLAAAGIR